ncbi:MAG: indolepyruvate oxidoreductase subunit beta [Candidatus Ranarchaeia archaeon]|jgi:indolepyruvate ferredoxin oxidoreductase beta subunit
MSIHINQEEWNVTMSFNIFICGVGGQGLVLLTNVIGKASVKAEKKVITGEMYGLSQRSGTVFVHLRIGKDAHSPLITLGGADIIVALEAMEALRHIEYLKKDGIILINNRIIHPPIETSELVRKKGGKYVSLDEILDKLEKWTPNIALIDALELAKQSGNVRTENTAFLGALSTLAAFPIEEKYLRESISEVVPPKTIEANLKAFDLGKSTAYEKLCDLVDCRKN